MAQIAHKIRLYPNNKQQTYFLKACGIRRFAYNWALAESKRVYEETGKVLKKSDLSRRFNAIKYQQFPWVAEVTKWAPQKAIYDAHLALTRWWSKYSNKPKFKKKGKCKESFYIYDYKISNDRIRVPKLGWVCMAQPVRFPGRVLSVTISRDVDRWFASFNIEVDKSWVYSHHCENQAVVGVDLGISNLAVTSDGELIENPKWLYKHERKLKRLHQSVSRKKKGSNNRKKAAIKLARQYHRNKNARSDYLHKLTTNLVKHYRIIGIEDLSVKNMMSNHCLAKSIGDAGFYEIRRHLEYKSKLSGSTVVSVDRFYPSSKLCSRCGIINNDLKLKDRVYRCPVCGLSIDRDLNAAYNLKSVALGYRDTINACGEESSGTSSTGVKLPSVKQEIGIQRSC